MKKTAVLTGMSMIAIAGYIVAQQQGVLVLRGDVMGGTQSSAFDTPPSSANPAEPEPVEQNSSSNSSAVSEIETCYNAHAAAIRACEDTETRLKIDCGDVAMDCRESCGYYPWPLNLPCLKDCAADEQACILGAYQAECRWNADEAFFECKNGYSKPTEESKCWNEERAGYDTCKNDYDADVQGCEATYATCVQSRDPEECDTERYTCISDSRVTLIECRGRVRDEYNRCVKAEEAKPTGQVERQMGIPEIQ